MSHSKNKISTAAMTLVDTLREAFSGFFEYDTPSIVHIKNKKVGVINRLVELTILSYIIGYAIIYKKGYQDFDDVKSAVTTKVKGIIYENSTFFGKLTWDVADYVIPPQETNAFFVITSFVPTFLQQQGNCPENPNFKPAWCRTNDDCQKIKGTIPFNANGPFTGKCVHHGFKTPKTKVCEIRGWCPIEDDSTEFLTTFNDSANFTVFIKNSIEFPMFGVSKRNIMPWFKTDSDLNKCRWKRDHPQDQYCPIFVLGDITAEAGISYSSLLTTGGIIKIIIDWTCNLDHSLDECRPHYSFRRVDRGNFTVSVGFNFRHADHYIMMTNNTPNFYRNLYKVFGVHFLVEVRGTAGKFSIVPLMFNIGSGMGLMGIAAILSDIIVLNFLKAKNFYRHKKIVDVSEEQFLQEEHINEASKTTEVQEVSDLVVT